MRLNAILVVAAVSITPVLASEALTDETTKKVDLIGTKLVQEEMTDPSLTSVSRLTDLQALLAATRAGTRVEAEIGLKTTDLASSKFKASFKLAGPIGGSESEARLATLEGLADYVTFSAGLHLTHPKPSHLIRKKQTNTDAVNALTVACTAGKREGSAQQDDKTFGCDTRALRRELFDKLEVKKFGIQVYSLEFRYGASKTFEYLDTESFERMGEEHAGYSAAFSVGFLPLNQHVYFVGLSGRYEKSYVSQPGQQICLPVGIADATQCETIAVGTPLEVTRTLAQLEFRKYVKSGALAVNPRYTHDFDNGVNGVELPLYFLKDGKGTLNGGIAVGWRDDIDSVTLSAFVGSLSNPLGN